MANDPAFPSSSVQPILFDQDSACNTAMPGGEVVEWFDFGQFVELIAVDKAGFSHPVVLTNELELAKMAGSIALEDVSGVRTVDVLGGIPIDALADASHDHGEKALDPLVGATKLPVADVDDLISTGQLDVGGVTYLVSLSGQEIVSLGDGETVTKSAIPLVNGKKGTPVFVALVPEVLDYDVKDLDRLLADLKVTVDRVRYSLVLEPAEVAMLLMSRTVVVRSKDDGGKVHLLRLNQGAADVARKPERVENAISDLPAFIANPQIPAASGPPIDISLTKKNVQELRETGATQVVLDDGTVVTIRYRSE